MKLVVATPLYPPEPGGPATYAKNLENGLPSHDIEVSLVKFGDVRQYPKVMRHFLYGRRVQRAAKHADLVLALDPVSTGLPAMRAAQKVGKPFVVKIVGDYAWEQGTNRFGITAPLDEFVRIPDAKLPFPVRVLRKIQTDVAMNAKAVIVPSGYLKGIVHAWGVPEEHITVIENGIALPETLPPVEKKGAFVVASAGRRVPWKGFEAIERVANAHDWTVDIISNVSRPEALARIKAADVFVLNSSYEGLSHVLIEAMTLGTPVIATKAGGNPTLVEDHVTGLLIPVGDEAALGKALEDIHTHSEEARVRAKAAQARMMEEFSVPRMLERTATFLTTLV
jgi:glycosyltransferase involved in cell wall biosynthesis